MIWIGGVQGAGKSTIAARLSRRYDLPLHPIDLWTYDHAARLAEPPALDDELTRGPHEAAVAFEATSDARIPLVVEDVIARGLGAVAAVVEGPQLRPAAAQPPGWSVWLLTDSRRTRLVRERRAAMLPPGAPARARLDAVTARDEVLSTRLRRVLTDAALPTIEVPPDPDWAAVRHDVEAALAVALGGTPRLREGPDLRRQRRLENVAAVRQGRLWQQAEDLPAVPPFPFACECGRSGCGAVWFGTPDDFDAVTAEPVTVDGHEVAPPSGGATS